MEDLMTQGRLGRGQEKEGEVEEVKGEEGRDEVAGI